MLERLKSVRGTKKSSFLMVLLAIACGFLAAGLVYFAGSKATPSVPVLQAKVDITKGDPLDKSMFKEVLLPPAGLPEGTLKPTIPLENRVAAHDLSAGDILRNKHTLEIDNPEAPLLSSRLKILENENMRAVEIPIDSISGMLEGMKAGDKVDIISVAAVEGSSGEVLESKKIISAAPVIGVQPQGDNSGVLIVALTEKQVVQFSLARELGKIHAALCPFGYEKKDSEQTVFTSQMSFGGDD